jgi:DNA adenine methylase
MGSKNRIAKEIIPFILDDRGNSVYIEPFVGGGNLIDKIDGYRIGYDVNPYVISALISIRDHLDQLPKNNKEFTESDYNVLRNNDCYEFKGYAGFAFSYGGKWMGGWCRDGQSKRDYVREAYRNAVKQSPKIQGVEFICSSYLDITPPERSIIYCDPPYFKTTGYKDGFDHELFWSWCRQKVRKGIEFMSQNTTHPMTLNLFGKKSLLAH